MRKKAVKKKISVKPKKTAKPVKKEKPIGLVTHFYGKIKVAIIKFNKPVKTGTEVSIRGAHTDFSQKIASMQYDHKPISSAPKGKEVGVKVSKKVHEGDRVFNL